MPWFIYCWQNWHFCIQNFTNVTAPDVIIIVLSVTFKLFQTWAICVFSSSFSLLSYLLALHNVLSMPTVRASCNTVNVHMRSSETIISWWWTMKTLICASVYYSLASIHQLEIFLFGNGLNSLSDRVSVCVKVSAAVRLHLSLFGSPCRNSVSSHVQLQSAFNNLSLLFTSGDSIKQSSVYV